MQISKFHFKMQYYKITELQNFIIELQNTSMSNFVILKWCPFEYKAKFEKEVRTKSEVGIFGIFFKRLYE